MRADFDSAVKDLSLINWEVTLRSMSTNQAADYLQTLLLDEIRNHVLLHFIPLRFHRMCHLN